MRKKSRQRKEGKEEYLRERWVKREKRKGNQCKRKIIKTKLKGM